MLIRQRAYVRLLSDDLNLDQMSEVMGVQPTRGIVKGSIQAGPPIRPRFNQWILESGMSDQVPLHEHLVVLWPILESAADRLRTFTERQDSFGSLRITRHFDCTSDDSTELAGLRFDRISKHRILGFDVEVDHLVLLGSIGFDFAVDEDT